MQNEGFTPRPDERVTLIVGSDRPAYLDYEDAVKLANLKFHLCSGHVRTSKDFQIQRLIMRPPKGMVVHHRDEDPFNNRKYNLEVVSNKVHGQRHNIKNKRFGFSKVGTKFKPSIGGQIQ